MRRKKDTDVLVRVSNTPIRQSIMCLVIILTRPTWLRLVRRDRRSSKLVALCEQLLGILSLAPVGDVVLIIVVVGHR